MAGRGRPAMPRHDRPWPGAHACERRPASGMTYPGLRCRRRPRGWVMSALLPIAALCCPVSAARAGSPDPSSVRIQDKITRYAITADSMDELRAQLRHDVPSAHGGNDAHGRTRSDIRIAYDLELTARGCRLRNPAVPHDNKVNPPH